MRVVREGGREGGREGQARPELSQASACHVIYVAQRMWTNLGVKT